MTALDTAKPCITTHSIQHVALPNANRSFDAMTTQKTEPFSPNKLTVCHEVHPALRWQDLKELENQSHSSVGVTVPYLVERNPDKWDGKAVYHSSEN